MFPAATKNEISTSIPQGGFRQEEKRDKMGRERDTDHFLVISNATRQENPRGVFCEREKDFHWKSSIKTIW